MNQLKRIISKILKNVISFFIKRIDKKYPLFISFCKNEIEYAQGYGHGSGDIHNEVRTLFSLYPQEIKNRGADLIILDIGANIGEYSSAVLDIYPNSQIYAFEPDQNSYEKLSKNLANHNVKLEKLAIGNEVGKVNLYSNYPGSTLSSLIPRDLKHKGIYFEYQQEVDITTLDNWNVIKIAPDVIKIDVEGTELEVLKGATKLLQSCKIVQFEFGGCNVDTRTYFKDFFNFFTKREFLLFRLTPTGIVSILNYSEELENFRTANYAAIKVAII